MKDKSDNKFLDSKKLILKLYVSGMSVKSMTAIENINRICNKHFDGTYQLEIIDIYKNPKLASEQQIVFSPSLVKSFPLPKKTLIGNFSNSQKVLNGLGIVFNE
jgi:circadian clock protein KaiB